MLNSIDKITIQTNNLKTNALFFRPKEKGAKICTIFTHGYTSHKGSILTWAQKSAEMGIPSLIFDLPGHFLGSYKEVLSADDFINETPDLFKKSYEIINQNQHVPLKPIIGGHSLGGLTALRAAGRDETFKDIICVGVGRLPLNKPHFFQTPFFEETMILRSELISKAINPEVMLPWIAKEKRSNLCRNTNIHLIAGKDDIVIGGEQGVLEMRDHLIKDNQVFKLLVPKLSHHTPENAGIFIKKIIKETYL